MALSQTLTIDIARRGTPHLPAKQADHGYDIIITVLQNGVNIVDHTTDTASYRVQKPDGNAVYDSCTVNNDDTITFHIDDAGQILAVPGYASVDISIEENGDVKSTQNFVLDIQAAPGGSALESSSVFAQLNQIMGTVNGTNYALNNAILECFKSVAWISDDGADALDELEKLMSGDYWIISKKLTNVEISNAANYVVKGSSYTATVSSKSQYTDADVTVKMNGIDITESVYNNGTITIPSVTGYVEIVAEVAKGYTLYDYVTINANLSANEAIITDFAMSSDYTFMTTIYFDSVANAAIPNMGSRSGGVKDFGLFVNPSLGKLGYWVSGTDTTINITGMANQTYNTIKYTPVGKSEAYPNYNTLTVNGTEFSTGSTATGDVYDPWFGLFSYANSTTDTVGSNRIGRRICETVALDSNGNVVVDFVPANNGTYNGFLDLVTNTFYYNATSYAKYECGNMEA